MVHTKREQSHESSPENNQGSFEFAWKLKLSFDPKMETIYPTLNVIDFGWGKDLSENAKADIMNLTYSLIDAEALYKYCALFCLIPLPLLVLIIFSLNSEISQKSFDQVPVAKDMVEIAKSEGYEVCNQKTDEPVSVSSFSFFFQDNKIYFLFSCIFLSDFQNIQECGPAKKLVRFSGVSGHGC